MDGINTKYYLNKTRLSPREKGTNPRAKGTNPRAKGTNPRAIGTNPRAKAKMGRPRVLRQILGVTK